MVTKLEFINQISPFKCKKFEYSEI